MSSEQNIERIAAYIAQNRAAYSIDALRAQLLAAGYNAADVDAAIARSEAPLEQPPPDVVPPTVAMSPATATPADSDDEAAIGRIAEYFERNRRQYTIEALRLQVLGQGQRPDLVEAALARVVPPQQQSARQRRNWPLIILVAVGNIFLLPVLAGLLTYGSDIITGGQLSGLAVPVVVVVEVIIGVALLTSPRWRWLGTGLLLGLLLAVAIVGVLLLIGLGICLVLLYQYTNP